MARYYSVDDIPGGSTVAYCAYGLLFDGITNYYYGWPFSSSSISAANGFWFDLEDTSSFVWPNDVVVDSLYVGSSEIITIPGRSEYHYGNGPIDQFYSVITKPEGSPYNVIKNYCVGEFYLGRVTVNNVTVNGGSLQVFGIANNITINSGGRVGLGYSFDSLPPNSTTRYIFLDEDNCTANHITVNSGGYFYDGGGTTISDITINPGGYARLRSASFVRENGGFVVVPFADDSVQFISNTFNGLVLSSNSATAHSGTTAVSTTVVDGGRLEIYNGGIANNTCLDSNGELRIIDGGIANDTTVNSGGSALVSGGIANNTTVNSGGGLTVYTGGAANNTTVNSGGGLTVYTGGAANNTTVNSGGGLTVYTGGAANNTTVNSGGSALVSGGIANNTTVNSGGRVLVSSGGTANRTTISSGGYCSVATAGIMSGCMVYAGGSIYLDEGAQLEGITTVGGGGQISFANGGTTVDGTVNLLLDVSAEESKTPYIINFGGWIDSDPAASKSLGVTTTDATSVGTYLLAQDVASDYTSSVAITVKSGEMETTSVFVWDDSTAGYTPVTIGNRTYTLSQTSEEASNLVLTVEESAAKVEVYDDDALTSSGETMSDVVLNADGDNLMLIKSGGTAVNTTAGADTKIIVSSGGTADDTTVNSGGNLYVESGGTANGTIVEGGALLLLADGAVLGGTTTLTGKILNNPGTVISADGAEINLVIDGTPGDELHTGYISNLNSLHGAALSITVTENAEFNESSCTYLLADHVVFTSDVSLTVAGDDQKRSFVWNAQTQSYTPITIGDKTYTLSLQTEDLSDDAGLYLTVTGSISDAAYEHIAHVLAYKEGHKDFTIGEQISFSVGESTYYYVVRGIYDDTTTVYGIGGFDAVLLERTDANGISLNQAVLGCGGTEQLFSDILSDVDPRGIGYHQFFSNADEVYSDCRALIEKGCSLSLTGHSLGGALAQWFAVYAKEKGGIQQIKDVITFNSPGISMTVEQMPIPISSTNKTDIKNVRQYIGYGDLVSMAGEWFLSGNDAEYILSNFSAEDKSMFGYFGDQHTTFYFNENGVLKNTVKTGSISELGSSNFSYLSLESEEKTDAFPNIVSVLNSNQNGYYLFNTQYAKNLLKLANGNIELANQAVIRGKVDAFRKEVLKNAAKYLIIAETLGWNVAISHLINEWKDDDYKKVTGSISVGESNLISTDGSTQGRIIRTLSYGKQDAPQILFDFTNQKFIKLYHCNASFIMEVSPVTSNLIIRTVLEEKGDQWICFSLPALDESTRYKLINAATNTGLNLSKANYIRKGNTWYIIDDPATEYSFTFSVDTSVTTEKAVILPENEVIEKETDQIMLLISDIDAASSRNAGSISVQVKTASNPDGMTVVLQESDVAGLFRGTVSVNSLNLTDDDDKLTIVYEDADNGTGVAETIEKVIDVIHDDGENVVSPPENLNGTAEKVSWEANGTIQYVAEYSKDNFEHTVQVVTDGNSVDSFELPAGTYQWRVKADGGEDWATGESIVVPEAENESAAPKVVRSNDDGNDDLFFVTPVGTWENIYYAQHVGSVNDWTGTYEIISAAGKGRIQNLFFGSSDPNVLCLTDSENGDAIFVDDVYTDLPEEIEEHTARLYRIQEIRAGAGDDIVDMTSQRFEYVGSGMIICGGDGDDVIWANKGGNFLSGDAGNDRIVGASGDDLIVGGIGNDRMHGGGGDDLFAFCENWGSDTVEQLETGTVTLWFASGSMENWNADTLTYTDGDNSVKVSGVTADRITLKFGEGTTSDDADLFLILSSAGTFADFTSERIFEESGKGALASL